MSDETRSDDDPQDTTPSEDGEVSSSAELDDSDFWDDEDGWTDGGAGRRSGGMPPVWIIAAVVLALVVIGVLVLKGGNKDDNTTTAGGASTTVAGATGKQCATWPGVGGLGKPKIADKPGIHMWSDLDGWHISRVPGANVPAVSATVTNNDTDTPPKPKPNPTGGATAVRDAETVKITLPASADPSQASFEPGPYSSAVVVIMNDDKGAALPTTAFTVGDGAQPSVNPITATQVMQACGS